MTWKTPPRIKVYEALGAIADKRIQVTGDEGTVRSSSGGKEYTVQYEPQSNAITANDNGSYWQGYLGYPAIAFLMKRGVVSYDKEIAKLLQHIAWKDINTKFKNDFEKTVEYIHRELQEQGEDIAAVEKEVEKILIQIKQLEIKKLPSQHKPPEGY